MKNRAALTLMELSVMVLVLALCAALCLGAFAWADTKAEENAARDDAILILQNCAELLRHTGGDLEEAAREYGTLEDGVWIVSGFRICVTPRQYEEPFLLGAQLEILREDISLGELTVCWQEVDHES